MSSSVNEEGIEVVTLSDSEEEAAAGRVEISVEEPDAMEGSDISSPLLPSAPDADEEENEDDDE